jgi:cell division protein FtsW
VRLRTATTLLAACVVTLLGFGVVMLASTSSVRAAALLNDPSYYLKRQLIWLGVGLVAAYVTLRLDYHIWQKMAVVFAVVSLVLLVLVFVPGIGHKVGGSYRWLGIGPLRLQPSEIAKIALIVGLSAWMCRVERRAADLRYGLLIPVAGLGVTLGLLILEPDFGTTILCLAVGMLILFVGGSRITYLLVAGAAGVSLMSMAIMRDPLRLGRLLAFMFPERYPATAYHLAQSKVAFIKGGLLGAGLGNSIQKQFYLPEAHTDFILAIIGEELGLIATGAVLLMFALILLCGLIISGRAPDGFGKLLGFGATMMLAMQAAINVGVVTGCLPTKGLPLPFISYGGSSLLASLTLVGILLSIARQGSDSPDDMTHAIRDRSHRF